MTYEEAKEELRALICGPRANNFHSLLYSLISKSDPANRERLRLAFPEEVKVWEDWIADESEDRFFAA